MTEVVVSYVDVLAALSIVVIARDLYSTLVVDMQGCGMPLSNMHVHEELTEIRQVARSLSSCYVFSLCSGQGYCRLAV